MEGASFPKKFRIIKNNGRPELGDRLVRWWCRWWLLHGAGRREFVFEIIARRRGFLSFALSQFRLGEGGNLFPAKLADVEVRPLDWGVGLLQHSPGLDKDVEAPVGVAEESDRHTLVSTRNVFHLGAENLERYLDLFEGVVGDFFQSRQSKVDLLDRLARLRVDPFGLEQVDDLPIHVEVPVGDYSRKAGGTILAFRHHLEDFDFHRYSVVGSLLVPAVGH